MDSNNDIKDNKLNIFLKLDENLEFFKTKFKECTDVIYRNLQIDNTQVYVIYIDGLIDKGLLMEQVLEKLLACKEIINIKENSIEKIASEIPITEISLENDLNTVAFKIMNGNVIVLIENRLKALSISLNKYANTEDSLVEPAILGPKESFTKVLGNNTALIRRYLNNEDCKIVTTEVGKVFQKRCSVVYLESIVNKTTLDEVFKRLNNIDLDIIMDSSNLIELIQDKKYCPFPTIALTERIDKVSASLVEGQIIILLDNSSFALILPSVFISFFHSTEDYYISFYLASFLRLLRIISYLIAIFLPGFYSAITLFNHELIPEKLIISIASQTIDTPFSSTIELIIMLFAFEMLRELGIRLPKFVGSTVSLVGALIIGETVVRAGLVSTSVVIVTAFTAISSMLLPSVQLYESILICRLIILFLGSTLGFWGIIASILLISTYLCSITSFGVPYVYSLVSNENVSLDDIIFRIPLWENKQKTLFRRKNKFLKKSEK